ncbi:MAG: response regulator transcription factor [Bacteroidales bacterium]|nr:response regulator transcription factor [Bacteroidales bacterium]
MTSRIDTLIVEPSEIVRTGLQRILTDDGSFSFLAPLSDAVNLEERVKALCPDLLIVNPTLLVPPVRSQLAAIQQLQPNMAIAALVYQYLDQDVLQLFRVSIDIREKRNRIAQLLKTEVDRVSSLDDDENYELSIREREVLVLVAQGLSSKQIADKLNISIHTVNSHRKNVTRKTGIRSVAGLAVYATLHNMA